MPTELNRIQKTIAYIEENFDREITSREIEDIACYSYRNFQRVFMKLFGETLSGFQKRLRLENAYKKLLYTTDKVSSIDLEVGYYNLQSFSKAFHKEYGISPAVARKERNKIFSSLTKTDDKAFVYEIVYKQSITVYTKGIKTRNYNNKDINALWEGIEEEIDFSTAYGIITDQPLITNEEYCRYEAAIEEPAPGDDYHKKTIFGKKYARFVHHGNFEHLLDTYGEFYRFWLADNPFLLDNSPVIEEYLLSESGEHMTYIYFPLHI
ncbi:AraC family transcriptional regulator [Elizabethkingia ursingii]|uniref:AraC family transcriptional regulator n=1 Tax=Elizabethkingia ursingii TaxID=1756150 RepID=UPI002012E197|nr:AraC family transcriptional regulator [Elizabethkingia ursingii]